MHTLTEHRPKLQFAAVCLPLIASFMVYLIIANRFIPTSRLGLISIVIALQIMASFAMLCLIFLLSTSIKKKPLPSILQILSWLVYALTFVFFSTAVMSLGDLFGPQHKESHSYPSHNKQLHVFEQDCWIDARTECSDYHTIFYLQNLPLPLMSEAIDCPCYFDDPPTQKGDTLEFASSFCNDDKERTLLFDLNTGRFDKNVCKG